jgi:kynurenine formamidase
MIPSAKWYYAAECAPTQFQGGAKMAFIDLSHAVKAGMQTYPGLPGPVICDFLSREASRAKYAPGTEFQIGKIELVANTGTYVDSPFHRYADGVDLAGLRLEQLADLDTVVISSQAPAIGPEAFAKLDMRGKAVLVHTGWSQHFGTPRYFTGHPFLTAAAAELLVEAGAAFVGIDSLNIDSISDGTRPVHTTLLRAGIPIGEHFTNLAALPARGARLHAAPVKVVAFGTFPVRAYAIV